MPAPRRPSPQTNAVLQALLAQPDSWRYGYELVTELAMNSGSLYPILMRLSERDLLEARWQSDSSPGRPPRHMYRLTGAGVQYAQASAAEPVRSRARLRPQGT